MECLSKILRLKRSGTRQLELVSLEDRLLFSAAPGPAPEAPADNAQIESVIMASLEAPVEILSDGTAEESDATNAQGLQPLGLDVDANTATHELVFIDTGAANYQDLLDDLWTHQDPDRQIDVVLLTSGEDGIAQITETLAQYRTQKLDAVHLVTHGAVRAIKLGNTWLDATALEQNRDQIASWGEALQPGADLLVYGCDLAGNDLGRALLSNLVDLTGADIAASIDDTGSSLLGGNWDLEYELGDIETDVAFSGLTQDEYEGLLAAFSVTTTADSGVGSLRQAILDANALAGADTISFATLGAGTHTISVASALPDITDSVVIDGWSALSYSSVDAIPDIIINGNSTTAADGFRVAASNVTIRGLNIQRFDSAGIRLDSGTGAVIQGNFIGLNATGTAYAETAGAMADGIQIRSGNNTIGGTTLQTRNVIAGAQDGIRLRDTTATGNVIRGNVIGSRADMTSGLGTTDDGIDIGSGAHDNIIGGSNFGEGNVIVSSDGNGIELRSDAGVNNRLSRNSIRSSVGLGIENLGTTPSRPSLSSATSSGGTTTIGGSLTSVASTTYRIEFYATPSTFLDAAGGEGRLYLGSTSVTTNGLGSATISATLSVAVNHGDSVSAIAIDPNGNTSEFAANQLLTGNTSELVVDTVRDVADASGFGSTLTISNLLTSRGTDGLISLREAIDAANRTGGINTIYFNLPGGGGQHTINLTSALPTITEGVHINASSDSDFAGTPIVELNGASAGASTAGLTLSSTASNSSIRGLVINRFGTNGILVDGADSVTIAGNYIGTDVTGLIDLGNGEDGIQLQNSAVNNTIGGLTASDRNVVSGNNNAGIAIDGVGSSGNTLIGNYIGLGSDGATSLGNTHDGVHLQAAINTVIGSSNSAGRNVISGNAINGIGMDSAVGTIVQGNYIGTNAAGTAAVGNQAQGIYLANVSTSNVIGTDLNGTNDATEGNLISGNADNGVQFWGANVSSNVIRGNIIGLNATQSATLGNETQGIQIGSGAHSNTIGGTSALAANIVAGNAYAGVELNGTGTSFNTVLGNFIGTNASNATGIGNGVGVLILAGATFNTIGGTTSSARNIISGNLDYGVDITGTGTNNNQIQGNYIGTNVAGTAALANGSIGVIIEAGASSNTIGGSTSARNIISGNSQYGIDVTGATTSSNVITSNYIGLDATGTTAISNGGWGVAVDFNAVGTIIGGTGVGDGNVISGNTNSSPSAGRGGIYVWGTNTRIQGNTIGLNAARTAEVANGSLAASQSAGIWVNGGGTGNQIGGTTASAANTISGNLGAGIATDTSTNTVSIQRNSIYSNSGLGIDLANDGVTLNDPNDSDSGTNTLLNFPVIYSAVIVGGNVTITGEARSGATVDFYESDDAAGSPGEGRTWIGSGLVSGFTAGTIDSTARQFSFTFAVGSLISGDRVTATATLSGSTSEFSSNVTARAPGITVTPTSGLTTTEAGGTASFTVVLNTAPTASVSIQLGSTDTTEGTISGATLVGNTLTFTTANWSTPQTITVTGANDSLSDGDITYAISTLSATSSDLNYNGINPSDVSVTNNDNDLYTISGTIYEDVDGDGQVSDDGVGLASAIVSLYRDDGDGVLDAGDTIVNSILANGSGQYTFTGLSNDTYWVVADSRSFIGTGGLNASYSIHDQWAEQTYGSTGSVGWNGSAYTFTGTAGAFIGGLRADRGDNGASLLTAEHVTRVAVASANVASVDYGFSYNVITNTRDGDEVGANNRTIQGSLRQFIQNSNALATTQSSNFQIGTGAQTISLTSILDNISDQVVLDATTQEGFSGTPIIVLDGNGAAGDGFHLTATADNSTIRGFVIRDFAGDAIEIASGSDGHTIAGNYLGALTTGGTDAGVGEQNGESGLAISGANNTIGGATAADRNVISGNNLEGIAISGTGATGNLIVGNYIGTTATGAGDLGNGSDGILLYGGASGNTIGGVNLADRNVISGNNEGIEITDSTTSLNVIQGNYIGLGSDGTTAIGNDFDGIHISLGAHDNTIGGTAAGARNVIAGSGANGIQIEGTGTDNNVVQGNFIGTDATGELDRGNASDGVRIGNGAQSNTIGGTAPEARNIISGNDGDGVDIQGTGTTGNVVQGNYIGTDDDGEQDLGNSSEGVDVSASGNTIGGSVAGAGNVVSGNNLRGIYVTGAGVSATIQGNYVGTDKDGLQALGNTFDGIEVNFGAGGVTIQDNLVAANGQWAITLVGTGAGDTVQGNTIGLNLTKSAILGGAGIYMSNDGNTLTGNTIGGSNSYGIYLTGSANNTIQGNFIGTNSTGATGLGNALQGIGIDGANSDFNLIGGTDSGEGNVIAHNTQDGIAIASGAGTGISILGNTFRSNGGLAIDLSDNGVTNNDNSGNPSDQDLGPNGLQNFPEFTSVQVSGSDLIIDGDIRTDGVLTPYRLEFYGNAAGTADATNGEGRIYLGSTLVTTDADGRASFSVTLAAAGLTNGDSVTGTVTRVDALAQVGVNDQLAYGSTSEFATNMTVVSANSAPTLVAATILNSIQEDPTSNTGTLVSQLVDTEATDPDVGALKGIAITAAPTANGSWEYTLNGTTWLSMGTPSTAAALLLPADATTAIRFVPNTNFNGVSGLLSYKAWDQTSGTAAGTADVTFSGASTAFSLQTNGTSVSVSAVNDQPVLSSLDGAPTHVEGGASVFLDTNVSVFDVELSALDDFNGATLTLNRQGGANPEDQLAFDGLTVTVSGTDLFVSGVQVGTYSFTGGTMSIAFGTGATNVQVNTVLQNIVYWNSSDNPPTSVQLDWVFSDGNSGTQGTGGALQATGSSTVNITPANDAPSITLMNVGGPYVEGGTPALFDSAPILSDPDSANFDTGTLTASIVSAGTADDRITIRHQGAAAGQIGVSGNDVTYGGTVIGTWTGGTSGSTPLVITFNNQATLAAVQALAGNVQFSNVSDNPSTTSRLIRMVVTDGDGGTSNNGQNLLAVTAVNDSATISLDPNNSGGGANDDGFAVNFSEGAGPVLVVDTDATINDFGEGDLETLGLSLSGFVDGAAEKITVAGVTFTFGSSTSQSVTVGATTFSLSYNSGFSVISITRQGGGNMPAGDLITVLQGVAYQNTSANPTVGDRTISFFTNEPGNVTTDIATATISVTTSNNAPVISTNTLSINEGGTVVLSTSHIHSTDPDNTAAQLTYTASSITGGQFELVASPGSAVTTFTQAQIDSGAVRFVHNGGETAPSYQLTVSDGSLSNGPSTVTISAFTNINDAPTIGSGSLAAVLEDTLNPAGATISSLVGSSFADPDSGASLSGIAITSNDAPTSEGVWQYSTDSGTSWFDVGTVGVNGLALDASTQVRFVPAADFNGSPTILSFRGLDNSYSGGFTSGATRTTVDTSSPGGTSPISSSLVSINTSITAVNDAPVRTAGTVGNLTVQEDSGFTSLGLSGVTYSPDGGVDENSQTLTYSVTAIPALSVGRVFLADGTTPVTVGAYTLAQIQGMQFRPTDNASGVSAFQFNVTDSGGTANGGLNSFSEFILLTVNAVNDAPSIATTSGTLAYAENDPATAIDPALTVSDVDNINLTGATVAITANFAMGEDVLAFTDQLGITGSWDSNLGVLTLTGTTTVANYQAALRSVTYFNTSGAPTVSVRTVRFTASDGAISSPAAFREISVAAVNNAPTITFGQVDITHTEGSPVSTIDGAVSVNDVDSTDFAAGTLTVTVSGGDAADQLVVQHQGTGVGQISVSGFDLYYNSGLGSVQIGTWSGGSGTPLVITFTSAATATEVAALSRAVDFRNTSTNPSAADRTVQFQLSDGDGGTSVAATKTIHFTTVNTAPTISGPPAVTTNLDTQVIFSTTNGNAISVGDPDAGLSSIEVRLSVNTGQLTLANTADLSFSVGDGDSDQTLTFTGTVAAIQAAMEGLRYTPQLGFSGADRLVVEVNDLGNTGSISSPLSATRGVNIYVGTVPFLQGDYLEIGFNGSGSLGSTIGAPTGFQSAGSILAAESDPERDGGTYDGDFILPGSPEEGWGVHVGGTTYSNNTSNYGSDPIVGNWGAVNDTGSAQSMTWNGAIGGVEISSQHTVVRDGLYLEIVVTLTNSTASTLNDVYYYRNVDPDNNYDQSSTYDTTNTILSQGNDGSERSVVTATQPDGSFISLTGYGENSRVTYGGFSNRDPLAIYNGTGLFQSGSAYNDEAISLAFHVPTLAAGQSTTLTLRYTFGNEAAPDVDLDGDNSTASGLDHHGMFVEDGGPVAIVDSDMTLFDADNDVLQGMTITLTNPLDGVLESLSATTTGTNISASYDSGTGVLSLSGQDTLASYRHVLSSVVYDNSSNTPNTISRLITIAVYDGTHTSPIATSTIDLLATNDPPVLLTNTLTISEGGTVVLSSADINASDPESPSTGLTFTVSTLSGGHFESVASGATITSFTQDQVDNGGIRFVHDGGEAAPAYTLTLSDGAQSVGPSAAVISFTNVNDAPVTGTASATANEDVSPILVVLGGLDVDGTITQIRVATLPANGVLYLNAAMTNPVVSGTDYATTAGQLSVYFAPTPNWNGSTSFTFAAIDNLGAIDATPATATIHVTAVNDIPVITLSAVPIEFTENNPVGLMVDLVVTDVDSATLTSATISITSNFVAGEDQLVFTDMLGITGNYNAATGVLSLSGTASLADYQTALRSIAYFNPSENPTSAARQFQVVVSDGSSPSVAVTRSFNINAVNDAPTISSISNQTINEDTVLGPLAFTVNDNDSSNLVVTAATSDGTLIPLGNIVLNGTGTNRTVTVTPSADLYGGPVTITLTVSDGSLTAQTSFDVTVQPVNDAPTVNSATFAASETANNGTLVGTVVAGDVDLGDTRSFSVVSGDPLGAFAIDGAGQITVADASQLDFETRTTWTLTVQVRDAAGATAISTITVNLIDQNDNSPIIVTNGGGNTASISLAENTTSVTTVLATDADAGTTVQYSVSGPDAGLFQIDINTGVLSFLAAPNFESPADANGDNAYEITVIASDGTRTDTQVLTVTVTEVNESSTTPIVDLNGTSDTIAENAAVGSLAGVTAFADDLDATDTVSYSLLNNASGRFAIDSVTGVVTVAGALDYESSTSHTIRVQALSTDGTSTVRDFTIAVTDANEFSTTAISDLNPASETLAEDLAVGSSVGVTAFADDLDGTDTISYTLLNDAGGRFAIDSVTGVVTLAQALNYETSISHTIQIEARSTDGSSSIRDFTFNVTDVNEFSTNSINDVDPAFESVAESVAVGTPVGVTAFADDLDGTDTVNYSLLSNAGGLFAIDAVTGVVTVAGALDFETSASHTIRVQALSTDGSSTFRDFTIAVTDVNEFATTAVSDTDGATNAVAENSAVGAVVGVTAFADDLDGTDTVTYSLDDNAGGLVVIDPVTGVVTVNGAIDFEATSQLSFVVRATSTDSSSSTQAFTVDVLDRNDNAPIVTGGQSFPVAENSLNGTPVGTVVATDVDTVGTIQNWQIVGGTGAGAFSVNPATGEITVADSSRLNFEATPTLTLQVTVSDGIQSSAVQTVTILLSDVNERPTLTGGSFALAENAASGTPVGSITASDVDAGDSLTYSIVSGNNAGAFAIDATTGQITVLDSTQLDFETTSSFTLTAQVIDQGGLTHQQSVTITLLDLNERPTLSDGTYHVPEWSALGASVGLVSASDVDAGDSLTYRFLAGNTGGRFLIDSSTGEIRVANSAGFTHESQSSFTLTVEVQDQGGLTHTAQMTVLVDNVNMPPVAVDDFYSLVQFEPLITLSLDGVLANDSDSDSPALTLTLLSGPANGTLTLNADGSFTYSSNDLFAGVDTFTYQLSDGLESSQVATVSLTVGLVAPGGGGTGDGDDSDTTDNESDNDVTTEETDTEDNSEDSAGGGSSIGTTTNPLLNVATQPRGSVDPGTPTTTQTPAAEFVASPFEPLLAGTTTSTIRNIVRAIERPLASALLPDLVAVSELVPEPVHDLTLSILENHVMWNQLNSFRDDLNSHRESTTLMENIVVGTTTAVSGGLTVGYVIWLIRGGSLLATMMSVMPTWISFDPLPVMDQFEDDELIEDEESLASIVTGHK